MLDWNVASTLLASPIAYHRVFATIGGGACAGLFLSQSFYWTPRTNDPDGWFYKSAEEWEAETGLTLTEQETARKRLKAAGLMEEKRCGMPCKLYFRINRDAFLKALTDAASDGSTVSAKHRNKDRQNTETGLAEMPTHDSAKCPILYTESTQRVQSESLNTPPPSSLASLTPPATPATSRTPATPGKSGKQAGLDFEATPALRELPQEPKPNTASHVLWSIEQETGHPTPRRSASREAAAAADMLADGYAEADILRLYWQQNNDPKRRTAYTLNYLASEINTLIKRPPQTFSTGLRETGKAIVSSLPQEFRAMFDPA